MAMLLLPEVFRRTWGIEAEAFWPRAIEEIRRQVPDFAFMAEVYWDLEWALQQQGFDYTYDGGSTTGSAASRPGPCVSTCRRDWISRPSSRASLKITTSHGRQPRSHPRSTAPLRSFPFLRRACASSTADSSRATKPGFRFSCAAALAKHPTRLYDFYDRLLALLRESILRSGDWRLLDCVPAWDGNPSWDSFIAFAWREPAGRCWVIPVNYADQRSQCYIPLPFEQLGESSCFET